MGVLPRGALVITDNSWATPFGFGSVGFHVVHLAGSADRLFITTAEAKYEGGPWRLDLDEKGNMTVLREGDNGFTCMPGHLDVEELFMIDGDCHIELEALPRGSGIVFEDKIVGGVIPREFIRPVEAGIKEALESGVLAGYPVVDVKVSLVFGSYHDVDSSEMAFKIAGSMAFKEAAKQAQPIILEPIMEVEVVSPSDFLGDVIGDLSSRRGKIGGMTQRGDAQVVAADVPLAEMFGYSTELRSMTQGRAVYTMQFDHYEEVPKNVAEQIVAKVKG